MTAEPGPSPSFPLIPLPFEDHRARFEREGLRIRADRLPVYLEAARLANLACGVIDRYIVFSAPDDVLPDGITVTVEGRWLQSRSDISDFWTEVRALDAGENEANPSK